MSYGFGLIIESVVALLLMLTIGYCVLLNSRLKRLKADEQAMRTTVAELIAATEMAERAVAGLKLTAQDCEQTLGERLKAADHFSMDLARQVSAGEIVMNRLSRIVMAARPTADGASAPAPDPKATAAAAQEFAQRTRERMSSLAA